ncbi:hypothetical protein KY285_013922 [Solanum tuberosum]|nr:hypothetical protein KY285_013922 [Solanum tuberosum]
MPRTTTQRAAGILDVDQATAINAKLDAMQHNIAMHFKQMSLNQAPVNMVQGANQYRSQEAGKQYQNLDQGANPNAPKWGMTNDELLQKLMADIGTKLNARIDKHDENIKKIQMSQMSLEKQVAQVANSLNLRPQGGLPDDTEPKPKQLNVVSVDM